MTLLRIMKVDSHIWSKVLVHSDHAPCWDQNGPKSKQPRSVEFRRALLQVLKAVDNSAARVRQQNTKIEKMLRWGAGLDGEASVTDMVKSSDFDKPPLIWKVVQLGCSVLCGFIIISYNFLTSRVRRPHAIWCFRFRWSVSSLSDKSFDF